LPEISEARPPQSRGLDPFRGRRLEESIALATALVVVLVVTIIAVVDTSVAGELRLGLLVAGLAMAVGAIAAGRWLGRRITAPLRRLVAGTQALATDDMSQRLPVEGARELVDLAEAFNRMLDRIQDKANESTTFQRALEALNATLEQQVRERTRALTESEAQYKTLVEHSPDVILIVQDGRVQFVNRAFVDVFGVSESAALAPDFQLDRLFDAWSWTLACSRIDEWQNGLPSAPMEVVGRDARGNTRDLEMRGSRIEYKGRPAAECLMIDLTETNRLRERLGETEKLRALGELASGVAHDFNNLLGAILGRVQLLRKKGFDEQTSQHLAVIERAAQDGRETVRRIQEFSRTRRDTEFTPVNFGEIMKDAVEITKTRWRGDAERRIAPVQVSLDTPAVPPVMGNASELREVFTNLILNAVDAMPNGGSLHLSCWEDCNKVLAEVRDSGVGMSEDTRRRLFDPFYTTKGPSGNGLGLSVVYGIVTRHSGRIDAASIEGKGTTFLLEFPSARGSIAVVGGDGAFMPSTLIQVGRILVIDDESDIAEVVRDALAAEGHTVETAHNGSDGLRLAEAMQFDLVFTDLGMPDMTGWEVAERLRAGRPDLPVVLVTGWGASIDSSEVKRRGIRAVVHKPFEIADILRTTASVLGGRPA